MGYYGNAFFQYWHSDRLARYLEKRLSQILNLEIVETCIYSKWKLMAAQYRKLNFVLFEIPKIE